MKSTGDLSRPYCFFEIRSKFWLISWIKIVFFCEFSNFSKIIQMQSAWGFFNIIFWNNHTKGLLGWYKPKFDFSELIWDSRYIPTLALNHTKTKKPGHSTTSITISEFEQDSRICLLTTLKEYQLCKTTPSSLMRHNFTMDEECAWKLWNLYKSGSVSS